MKVELFLFLYGDGNGNGDKYEVRYVRPASKGDTIFGTRRNWLISVNVPWMPVGQEIQNNMESWDFKRIVVYAREIKKNEDRHYILIEVTKIVREYEKTEREEIPRSDKLLKYKGLDVFKGETEIVKKRLRIVDVWTPEYGKFKQAEVEEIDRDSWTSSETVFEVSEETEFTRLFSKAKVIDVFDPLEGVYVHKGWRNMATDGLQLQEDKILELSKYYVIAYPEIVAHLDNIYLFKFIIFYDGRKHEFNFTRIDSSKVPPPLFRIQLRRLALSKHYKRLLWFGKHYGVDSKAFFEFVEDLNSLVNELDEIKERVRKVRELTSFERFLEMFYIRTPKRKFKALEPYFDLYEKVCKYIKDKPTMYIAFPNKYGNESANYPCIKVENGKYTIHAAPPSAGTCFVFKGAFEKAYREAMGLNKLITFQYSSVDKKLEMLKKDIEELRNLFENVEELHPERDIMSKLFMLARDYNGENLALILYKARNLKNAPDQVTLLKIAGLIKSGKEYDYTRERLSDVLKALRIAVKYEIKSRDYSPKIGVILSGTPETIATKIAKVVERLEGREAGLMRELLSEEVSSEEVRVPVSSRIIALLHDIKS